MRPHSNLHSTMYLLNPLYPAMPLLYQIHLHSTMYLLNLALISITPILSAYLHSTMYLLNRSGRMTRRKHILYLHSTMYLLNQSRGQPRNVNPKFTFHYVSIKSTSADDRVLNQAIIYIPLCIY